MHPPDGVATVLVVDDDPHMLGVIRKILQRTPWRVLEATSGDVAIDKVRAHAAEIDLVLIDVVLPVVDGCRAAAKMREIRPELPVLFMSGYGREVLAQHGAPDDADFIAKPFSVAELRARLSDFLSGGIAG